jgi:hypothetical protein
MEKQKDAVLNANFSFEDEPVEAAVKIENSLDALLNATIEEPVKPVSKKKTEKVAEEVAKDEDRKDNN